MPKISPDLLSVLRCPVTGSTLVQEGEELVSTAVGQSGETLRYAIEDGIPLLLPPELVSAANSAPSDQHDGGPGAAVTGNAAPAASE
ncbi:Trm112 family protein [Arthrobacter sp. NPDC058288]|uniref:Trm112 family protein n=1 Tax=Arthrobacter sp. NPDC058288 TaxID=3346424 RepID=UPI0036F1643B